MYMYRVYIIVHVIAQGPTCTCTCTLYSTRTHVHVYVCGVETTHVYTCIVYSYPTQKHMYWYECAVMDTCITCTFTMQCTYNIMHMTGWESVHMYMYILPHHKWTCSPCRSVLWWRAFLRAFLVAFQLARNCLSVSLTSRPSTMAAGYHGRGGGSMFRFKLG